MRDMGFEQGENEPCVFRKPGGFKGSGGAGEDFTVATWVDDCICRGGQKDTDWFYKEMAKRFAVKDPSYLTPKSPLCFVGMDMTARAEEKGLVYGLNQNASVRAFLEEHGVAYNTAQ